MSQFHIYKASAGAGKTQVLVSAYLELALQDPLHFRKILAITFTKRATQEMRHRILTTLNRLSVGKPTPISNKLCKIYQWNKENLQERAKLTQSALLHNYDYYSVSTIDSFFQRIIRNFARELNLPFHFKIEIDHGQLLKKIVAKLIEQSNHDSSLYKWLILFAEHNVVEGKPWNFEKSLREIGNELFTEEFSKQYSILLRLLQNPHQIHTFLFTINEVINTFEKYLQALGEKALQYIQQADLRPEDFAYGMRGVIGYLTGLAKKKNFMPTQRSLQAQLSLETWYSKKSPHQLRIASAVKGGLQAILQEGIAYYQNHYQAYKTGKAIQQFIHTFSIISYLIASLEKIRAEENIMMVSDTSYILRQLIANNDTPFVYEKLGSFYNYFLLDEFQDISDFQWQNLKPLIQNSLASGHISLAVGDVKQAIYRWRGSQWQLLSSQLKKQFINTNEVSLTHNWRSKANIIRFNNTFFPQASEQIFSYLETEITQVKQADLQEKLLINLQEITSIYATTHQSLPMENNKITPQGHVEINFIPNLNSKSPDSNWKEMVKARLPSLLETIQKNGFKPQDIAFLVRNHSEAQAVSQMLLKYQQSELAQKSYHYAALSASSLYIARNPWANIVLSALTYLADPSDSLAKIELAHLYKRYVSKEVESLSHIWFEKVLKGEAGTPKDLLQDFFTKAEEFVALPLYICIAQLVNHFQLMETNGNPFIEALLETAAAYVKNNSGDLPAFLIWWKEEGNKKALSYNTEQDVISIMTIHQAKGLQFKVVIIPFCAWLFDHPPQKGPILWCHTPTAPFSACPTFPIRYDKSLQDTLYEEAYYGERMQIYLDHFNLLYVAFTRAEDRLYIFAPAPAEKNYKTTGDLLYQTIQENVQKKPYNEDFIQWAHHWNAVTQRLTVG